MVTQMTNRLLATVVAIFLSSALTARAAQDVHVAPPSVKASSLPAPLAEVATTAATVVDPTAGRIRQAYQQDHDALEHLRQAGSGLAKPWHQQLNQLIDSDQAALLAMEKAALDRIAAGAQVNGTATIAQMNALVAQAQTALKGFQAAAAKSGGNTKNGSGSESGD